MTTDQVRAGITEIQPFFKFGRKVVFWPKMGFIAKKHPKLLKRLIFIWEKATFFFEQLFRVVARTWLELRSEFFWCPKSWVLAQKAFFCHTTPILINDLFLATGETVHFPHWGQFFVFFFLS